MKKLIISVAAIFALAGTLFAAYTPDKFDEIAITGDDVPEGFVIGLIPEPAQKVLKSNPWHFDKTAIQKLTDKIYPDGDYRKVSGIHMTIIAEAKKPYNDNIVCYMILFKDTKSAKTEFTKLSNYVGFNSDRAILFTKDNLAVFIHADDTADFDRIHTLSEIIQSRIK